MTTYHQVRDGQIVATREFSASSAVPTLASNKGEWLPEIVVGYEPFDPTTQIRTGPVQTITATQVVQTYTVRAKNAGELAEMIAAKVEALELEYRRRNALPFQATVDGVERTWHGDAEAMGNIEGINLLIVRDPALVPDPRPWKPYEAPIIDVSNSGFLAIGAAFAARKDAHFTTLQTLKATVRAMADPADVAAFDPLAGWD
jgi:hypothetical protein